MNIDWSKAPEGATHYYTRGDTPWRDLSGENWKWWANGKWNSDNAVHASIDRSSRSFFERRCAELIPRPLKTPEQIAVEVRDKGITAMINACGNASQLAYRICGDLFDAGYRKFEIVEEDV